MEAVVLAGGKGTRLLPHTAELPKPLVPLGKRTVIEYLLLRLKQCGVKRVHLAVNHMADAIQSALGDGSAMGIEINYSHESSPLSTIGPLTLIKDLPEHFLVINSDIVTDLDFSLLHDEHIKSNAIMTVATHNRSTQVDYGVLEIDSRNQVTSFKEKPRSDLTVSMGVYVCSRRILKFIPQGTRFGFDDLMHTLLNKGEQVRAFPYAGFWLDIGQPTDYERANAEIERLDRLINSESGLTP